MSYSVLSYSESNHRWVRNPSFVYGSIVNIAYNYDEKHHLGMDLFSFNINLPFGQSLLFPDLTVFSILVDESEITYSFLRANIYLQVFDISYKDTTSFVIPNFTQIYDYFYIHFNPLKYKFSLNENSTIYSPQIIIGNELCFSPKNFNGALGLGIEMDFNSIMDNKGFELKNMFMIKAFYTLGVSSALH